jgi:acyl-CoA reductase-like NAD-dependent aldehyde dehydrogenase
MKIFQQEVFGPVVSITTFRNEEEAIKLANDSCFGLGASIWSMDIKQVHRVSKRLDVGLVWANAHHFNDPSSPWGGMKLSGKGRENGEEAYRHYSGVVLLDDDDDEDAKPKSTKPKSIKEKKKATVDGDEDLVEDFELSDEDML